MVLKGGGRGRRERRFSRDRFPVCFAVVHREQFRHGQGCSLFDIVHSVVPLPAAASPILQGALKDDLGEAVMARDMSEPSEFPSLDSCQKRFLWAHEEVDLAPVPGSWSCASNRRCGEVSSSTCSQELGTLS